MIEVTFGFVKPDAYAHRQAILDEFVLPSGLSVVGTKDPYFFTKDVAREHYMALNREQFFESLIQFTLYGLAGLDSIRGGQRHNASTALYVLEGENAVQVLSDITGKTDPGMAKQEKIENDRKTIRSEYGMGMPDNAFHRADSHKSVRREIMIHFQRHELPQYVWEMLDREPYS